MLHRHSHEGSLPTAIALSVEPISMRIADACKFTGLSRSTIYVLIAQGKIRTAKVGRSTLVLTGSLKCFLSEAESRNG